MPDPVPSSSTSSPDPGSPTPSPQVNIYDPYIKLEGPSLPPPDVAAPPPQANTLTITLPSDGAKLVMGLGKPDGISMSSKTSVNMKAGVETSSVSVGSHTGINGGAPGISMETTGKLTETIGHGRKIVVSADGSTEEITGERKTTNTGTWVLHTTDTRTDNTDAKYVITSKDREDTTDGKRVDIITGKYSVTCQDKSERVLGKEDKFLASHGVKNRVGNENNTFVGTQLNTNISLQTNINASVVNNLFFTKIEYCMMEIKQVTVDKKQAMVNLQNNIAQIKKTINKIAQVQIALEDKAMSIVKSNLAMVKAALHIKS